jgi:hypothetical protein
MNNPNNAFNPVGIVPKFFPQITHVSINTAIIRAKVSTQN